MARGSDEFIQFEWHRPRSVSDVIEQVSTNCFCACVLCCGGIGTWIWKYVIMKVRYCCGLWQPRVMESNLNMEAAKRMEENTPTPPPLVRNRTLTLPLPEVTTGQSSELKQRTDDQLSSIFVTMLPMEVRQMIWKLVLSGDHGRALHIFRNGKKLSHWQCMSQINGQPCTWNDPCLRAIAYNTLSTREMNQYICDPDDLHAIDRHLLKKSGARKNFLPLLLTCRKMFVPSFLLSSPVADTIRYSETITLLYTTPHFHFPNPGNVRIFRDTILPQRLNSIRTLSLDWTEHFPQATMTKYLTKLGVAWDIISQMEGLQELRVYAKTTRDRASPSDGRMRGWSGWMRKRKGLKVYEFVVPHGQLGLWEEFIDADREVKLVGV